MHTDSVLSWLGMHEAHMMRRMDEWDVKGMLHVMKQGTNHYYRCTIVIFQAIITDTRLANTACHFWVVRRVLGGLVQGWAQQT